MSRSEWKEALEANFGAYRLIVDGTDVRGFWSAADADRAAAHMRTHSWCGTAIVRDNRPQRVKDAELERLRSYTPSDCVEGDLGSVPL